MPPMYVQDIIQIERDLKTHLNNPETNLSKYTTDFELYSLGEFDTKLGIHDTFEKPEFIFNLSSLKEAPQNGSIKNKKQKKKS